MRYEPSHARTVHLDSILKGELAENEFRKDFTHSERVAIGDWRLAIGDWRLAKLSRLNCKDAIIARHQKARKIFRSYQKVTPAT